MKLEFEFTFAAALKAPVAIGAGPFGARSFHEVESGTVEGQRLNGKVLTGGGDWLLIGADGWGQVDVRAQFLTDDGAAIYGHYTGLLELNAKIGEAIGNGAGTDYGDHYFRTTPRFETGDPRYGWLNHSLFVAEGRVRPGGVEYKVYRVV